MRSLKVSALMQTEVIALDSDHSINLAEGVMRLSRIRHLPVVEGGRLVGLVTHRDLVRAQAAYLAEPARGHPLAVPVRQVMQTNVWTVTPDTSVLEAAQIMLDHKFGCLPVVDGQRLVGIVTEADFLALLIRALESRRPEEDTDPGLGP